eukprot:CAMPEP_0172423718 /NCGR_PEP_ID=MMETSP1064-20121228/17690_1 /TAXON_ID=202472 /ORGANISM="Aulacoseira subarctica , Strain CCAP 1002/5" /LENGTH=136 /DNA_ID=CAMNT_0013165231 /DNA_START=1 /DNA_END=411 /DNA_ORIENTATION=+
MMATRSSSPSLLQMILKATFVVVFLMPSLVTSFCHISSSERSIRSTSFSRTNVKMLLPAFPANSPIFSNRLHMGFGLGDGDEPPPKLTRDNEPEDFFSTNMDKMSDDEKLPVALIGLAFISLPFIAGLIALYAAKS